MIPKKIYLRKAELEDNYMCERMVSCDVAIGSCNVEYTGLSQVWHDVTDKPKEGEYIVVMFESGNFTSWNVTSVSDVIHNLNFFNVKRWAYANDLLPKKIEEI